MTFVKFFLGFPSTASGSRFFKNGSNEIFAFSKASQSADEKGGPISFIYPLLGKKTVQGQNDETELVHVNVPR